MNKTVIKFTLAFGVLTLIGAGCATVKNNEKTITDTSVVVDTKKMMDDTQVEDKEMMKNEPGQYIDYNASKLAMATKGPVVLFFHATWCPSCKATDADVTAHLKDIPGNLTILKVDYDSNPELKKKYGVTYQHTFVQVDASGNVIKKWSGSPSLADIVAHTK